MMRLHLKSYLPVVFLGVILISLLPQYAVRQESTAKKEAKYIRRVYSDHTVGQIIASAHAIDSIQLLLRTDNPGTKELILTSNEQELGRTSVDLTGADQWVRISFTDSLPAGKHILTLQTDSEVEKESAILVRFQIDSQRYEEGNMVVDGQDSYGDLAFKIEDRVFLAHKLFIWGQVTYKSSLLGARHIVVGLALILITVIYQYFKPQPSWITVALLLGGLAALAIAIRAPYTSSIEGVFGGDAFNYLSKSQALIYGEDPFASDPRKGPFLPFLLAPGFLTPDPLLWSRWVGIVAAAASVVTLTFVARSFKLPWAMALVSGLLLAVNIELIWEAPSGLANTLYTFLITASLAVYLRATSIRSAMILAVLVGSTVLTRYEGILVAGTLLPALWLRERFSIKAFIPVIVLAAIIIAIPYSSWFWSGQSGVRTFEDLSSDSGLFLATSEEVLQENIDRLHHYTNKIWLEMREKNRVNFSLPALGLGFLVSAVIVFSRKRGLKIIIGSAAWLALLFLILIKSSDARDYLVSLPLFFVGAGFIPLIKARRFDAIVILIVVVAQLTAITLILPKSRYYLQLIPIHALLMTFGIYTLYARVKTFRQPLLALGFSGILASLFYFDGLHNLSKRTETYNKRASIISVMVDASNFLRQQTGMVGMRPSEEQPAIIYIPRHRRLDFRDRGDDIVQGELNWLKQKQIKFAVERNQEPRWISRESHPEVFELFRTFDTDYGDEKVFVYKIRQDQIRD